jgi:hypothetical protein
MARGATRELAPPRASMEKIKYNQSINQDIPRSVPVSTVGRFFYSFFWSDEDFWGMQEKNRKKEKASLFASSK